MAAARRNLVIVRANEQSRHPGWLAGAGERSWDFVVSWYGEGAYHPIADELVLRRKGGKWDIIHEHLQQMPELIDRYDYFWIVDDDIETDGATIERLFAQMRASALTLGQPALTENSYFSHLHTLHAPSFRLRYTSFVEVMAPCLSRAALRRSLPLFHYSRSGFGLDHVWARLEDDNFRKAAIIDAAPVRHTRPVGQFFGPRLLAQGIDVRDEERAILQMFDHEPEGEFPCYGGVTHGGLWLGQLPTALLMYRDYQGSRKRWVEPGPHKRLKRLFRHVLRPPALQRLRPRLETDA